MTSIVQERENFLRLAILVIDHSKAALISLIELDILNKHLTFEQFLNQNQHEIYHLCYNNRRCCRCSPGSSLSRIHRIIFPSQMQVLFDTAANMHGHRRGPEYCCSFAKKGIGTDVLDLILARCLLVYCCTDVFWYSCLQFKGTSFEDFLNQNKHMIYHCRQYNQGCCHCQNHCKLQANRQIVNAHQWNAMFISSSGLQMCRKRSHSSATNCICFISAITGITEGNLDIVLQQTILEYCCSTRKSVETLVKIRNNVYGNTNSTRISDSDYTRIKNDIESAILDIAIVCGNEPMSKTALNDVYCRNFDHSQFVQYQNSLSETNRDTKSVRELLAYIQSSPMTLDQVMKTLQTIKEGQNADKPIDAKLQKLEDKTETISSIIESDSKIPDEINRLDKKSIERYCQLLKGKMDKRQHFRLVVVGPKGSGKTSLVRRILQQPLDKPSKVRSTNGIDIHILKSKIQTKSGKWIFMEGVTNRQVANMRLKRCLVEKNQNQETVEKNDVLSDKDEESKMSIAWSTTLESRNVSPISSSDKSDILNRKDFYPNSRLNNEEGKISDALPTILESEDESEDLFYSRVQQSISEIDLEDVLNVELDENEFATIDLWDFAGDRQFYNTHHTFLSKEALYIVTVDMTKDVESILGIDGEDPNFWFQTLHYYGNKVNTRTRMDPSVILVGTKIDLCRVQVWKWECSKNKIEKSYSGIRTLICSDIERAQVNRYKSNIPYKTQLKCNITLYSCFKGMKDHDQLRKMEEYYCEEHEQSHDAKQIWTDWYEEDPKESLIDLNHRHINFTKMGIITLDVLADALYDLILVADPNFTTPRSECDISKLYEIHRNKMNVFIPSRGRWGGQWVDLNTNATAPGDDIERIRLTRNELQHSSKFELQDARFFQLCNLHKKVLGRFETKNNVFDYVQRFEIILNKKIAFLDWKRCKENIIFVCAKLQLPSSITASKGCGCTINCEINSRLPSESRICWFKDHNGVDEPVIVDSIKYHGSTIEFPSLVISNADKCDEGFYACRIMYPTDYQYEEDTETVVWPKTYLHVNNQ
ncbi:uncharacterized protein LOC127699103 isoform X2 [Mytilus californianus]|uniref:uncharacterized protein LOC127699103 isoform X2 n=1 Tax=Mytilus californianus TaxID=6549 RepID=UPI0022456221|nr:uncharacterized protein LOC127699103 isoform X2 [Mytilus californianus]